MTFSAGDKAYGIDIMAVREIRSWSPTTELPGGRLGARGVLDIRGSIVEVYDLSAILGGPSAEPKPGHVVLVVALAGTNVGILVDSVSDIIFADRPISGRHPRLRATAGLTPKSQASSVKTRGSLPSST